MLGTLKRWFSNPVPGLDWPAVAAWARPRAYGFKRVKDEAGFVVDGHADGRPWRLEWGVPQRSYMTGSELRLRMDLGLSGALQMLVLSRALMETLEKATFEQYTQATQTAIDMSSPEEMRWLAMFPKLNLPGGKALRAKFGGVSSDSALAAAWLGGPLGDCLLRATQGFLAHEPPFVLMSLRGRMCLRMRLDSPDPAVLNQVLGLFEVACASVCQLSAGAGRGQPAHAAGQGRGAEWLSTATSVWHSQLHAEHAEHDPPAVPLRLPR